MSVAEFWEIDKNDEKLKFQQIHLFSKSNIL